VKPFLFRRTVARDLPQDLKTQRLRLVAMTPAMLHADLARDGSLSATLHARLTTEWPPKEWEPHVVRMILQQQMDLTDTFGWNRYVVLKNKFEADTLIGCVGGFLKAEQSVEIGYSTLPSFQRRGFATEAARALVDWLLQQKNVRCITAQTMESMTESVKVMERCGLQQAGVGDDEGTVRYTRNRG
jgi:ribosomal-protein-alanine N-acetyltransferase